jgi:arylsulfatase A-like enzyme
VSFSSTDYIGHLFGPSSLEAEDNLLRLDRTLAELFAFVDKRVGLENTLIVLSADHGAPEAPAYLKKFGIEAKSVFPKKWDKAPALARLKRRFGIGQRLIESFFPPYLYLNRKLIKEKGLDLAKVESAVAKEIMAIEGVALAVSASALEKNELPSSYLNNAARKNFNPKRSGDILVLFEPHCFINGIESLDVASNHGGPWRYDTFVPVIFAGWGLKGKQVFRPVRPNDIAPTLSKIVGAKPPSGANGEVLEEITRKIE